MAKAKHLAPAVGPELHPDLDLLEGAVLPTGNDWIALPTSRAADGGTRQFSVLSMAARGLLEVSGPPDGTLFQPFVRVDGVESTLAGIRWQALGCWVPRGLCRIGDLELTFTVCAPL